LPIRLIRRVVRLLPFLATLLTDALPTATTDHHSEDNRHQSNPNSDADNGSLGQFDLSCIARAFARAIAARTAARTAGLAAAGARGKLESQVCYYLFPSVSKSLEGEEILLRLLDL